MATLSQAEILSYNLVGKASDVRLAKNYHEDTGVGEVDVQVCPACKSRTLIITAESKVMKSDTPIHLNQLKTYLNADRSAPMRLQFHKYTKHVIYINLNTPNKEMPQ